MDPMFSKQTRPTIRPRPQQPPRPAQPAQVAVPVQTAPIQTQTVTTEVQTPQQLVDQPQATAQNVPNNPMPTHKHHKPPILAITIALIIGFGLAIFTVVMYLKSNSY